MFWIKNPRFHNISRVSAMSLQRNFSHVWSERVKTGFVIRTEHVVGGSTPVRYVQETPPGHRARMLFPTHRCSDVMLMSSVWENTTGEYQYTWCKMQKRNSGPLLQKALKTTGWFWHWKVASASGFSVISVQPRLFPPKGGFLPYWREIISMKVNGADAVLAFSPFLGNVK